MTGSAIEILSQLVIGTVESVSPSEIAVRLDPQAPHSTALNTGFPTPFPRLNSYVLLPNEAGATIAFIKWMGIGHSATFSHPNDKTLIDLPFPNRKMIVSPIGTLLLDNIGSVAQPFRLERGVRTFPSVGDQVLIPTQQQIAAIVGAKAEDRRVRIGTSPMAMDADILVDPDKIFGRHIAILGNTGSGKSCSVAGLIRWSLEESAAKLPENGLGNPNARFIILDPNGEYAKAFSDQADRTRVFRVPPLRDDELELRVPSWLWNGHEWAAVAQAGPGAQRPVLFQGLRELRSGALDQRPRASVIRGHLTAYSMQLATMLGTGRSAFSGTPGARFACARALETLKTDTHAWISEFTDPIRSVLSDFVTLVDRTIEGTRSYNPSFFEDFRISELEAIYRSLVSLIDMIPERTTRSAVHEDAPVYFDLNLLSSQLEHIASQQGGNLLPFVSSLGLRIRSMVGDQRLERVINPQPAPTFEQWLSDYVGSPDAQNGEIAIIDLSLISSDIVHVIVSVLARLVFEALQRFRRMYPHGRTLPTVLVLEEAHNFVKGVGSQDGSVSSADQLCREIFERIAREGRKFGLGLVVSSQRPSELSPTLLAQCNTFLLHRIVNDADQRLVSKLVPDNIGGLLSELPSLPSRQAILLGWAAPIPVLVEMRELDLAHQPQSADPDFWAVWTRERERTFDWADITRQWH